MNGQQQAFKKGAIMGQVAKIIQQIQNGLYQTEAILQATESSLCSAENNKPDPLALASAARQIIQSMIPAVDAIERETKTE